MLLRRSLLLGISAGGVGPAIEGEAEGTIGDKRDWFQVVDRALQYNISSTI